MIPPACHHAKPLPPYPWQQAQWQQFLAYQKMGRLPHALLLLGQAGLGKSEFAKAMAQRLLCQAPGQNTAATACCAACQFFQAGTHPDFTWLAPEDNSQFIKIEQIRTCIDNFTKTSQLKGPKVVVFANAEALNTAAYNALLKTLEEPSGHACLILIAENSLALPATLRSRCQALHFNCPSLAVAKQWLASQAEKTLDDPLTELALYLANGSPISAHTELNAHKLAQRQSMLTLLLELAKQNLGPVTAATQLPQVELREWLNWLTQWLISMVRYHFNADLPYLIQQETTQIMQAFPQRPSKQTLFNYLDQLYGLRIQLYNKANINPLLAQEKLLINWQTLGLG